MPGDGADGGKRVTHCSVDNREFSRWLPSARREQSGCNYPESPKAAESHNVVTRFALDAETPFFALAEVVRLATYTSRSPSKSTPGVNATTPVQSSFLVKS